MKETFYKLFWVWEYDKEEKWLNEMAAQGWALSGVGFCRYTFDKAQPGEYTVRLQLLNQCPASAESMGYLRLVEDSGAEYVGRMMRWVYFRKKGDKDFRLFSDNRSQAEYLGRIQRFLAPLTVANLGVGLSNLCMGLSLPSAVNGWCGCLSLTVAAFLGLGWRKVWQKRCQVLKECDVFE